MMTSDNTVVSEELKRKVETVVLECLLKAQEKWGGLRLNFIPEIVYNTKGRAAGMAHWDYAGKHCININPILLNENVEYIMGQTVPHELAHLITYAVYGRNVKPHGREWKHVMHVLGKVPNRCHALDVSSIYARKSRRSVTVVKYYCECGDVLMLTSNRVTKMRSGRSYRHIRCGASVTYEKLMKGINREAQ